MLQNKTISEVLAIKGSIIEGAAATGSLYSNFTSGEHTDRLQAVLQVGDIVGTADVAIEQAYTNLNAVGQTTTASASASATTLVVSGGVYETNDWVSADGVNFVRVTSGLSGAGNLSVTALPADVASGASIVALKSATSIAALSTGRTSGSYPFLTQTPALAEESGVYTLDVRASDANTNNPAPAGDGTGGGYNPAKYIRLKVTLDTGSNSTEVSALLLDGVKSCPAYELNATGVVNLQIQA